MKICIITPGLAPYTLGGIDTHVLILAQGLGSRGHEVTVAGCHIHPQARILHDWGESLSLEYHSRLPMWMFPGWRLAEMRVALAVRWFLERRRESFDVVEISNWPGYGAFLPLRGFRYVARLSSPTLECSPPPVWGQFVNWLEGRTCRRADLILANSEAMRRKAIEYYRCGSVPSAVVHYGVPDVDTRGIAPPKGQLWLLYIGRAERRKGTDLFIRALSDTMPRCPRLHVRMIGGSFDDYAAGDRELRAIWRDLRARYADRITPLGHVNDEEKCRAIAMSHWLICPSRFESFGLVAIEAMRAGTPVLAAAAGGLPEVCAKGPGNVLYSPPEDSAVLAQHLEELCSRGEDYALGLRQATREAYLTWFTADRFVEQSLEHYRRIAAPSREGWKSGSDRRRARDDRRE
jgi:glycosyltransferase involved in cell wall biosynthesis